MRAMRVGGFTMGNLVACGALLAVVTVFASCTDGVRRARTAGDLFAMGDGIAAGGAYEGGSGRVRRVIPIVAGIAFASAIALFTGGADRIVAERAGDLALTMRHGLAALAQWSLVEGDSPGGMVHFIVEIKIAFCADVAMAAPDQIAFFAEIAGPV